MPLLLAPLRLAALLLHVLGGIAILLAWFPMLAQPRRNRIIAAWSRGLVWLCGARIRVGGVPVAPATAATGIETGKPGRVIVANHISWIDIFALDAAVPCRFVAKSEIGRWPLLGALVTLAGTLYIVRGRRHAVAAINRVLREHLKQGETIALFPEGTTGDGTAVLPFHSNLLAPAMDADASVWPVALRYTEGGEFSTAAAFVGETTLAESVWRVLTARKLEVEITILPAIAVGSVATRHALAERAHAAIAAHLSAFARVDPADFPAPQPAQER
jgi:1-acyl-sn-glycerol-3-phosphate acyltransferase